MRPGPEGHLSRREREVMDILHRMGEASAADVRAEMEDPPSDPAVRSVLRILEEKGHVEHRQEGRRYIYSPSLAPRRAKRSALKHLVRTFFDGSPTAAMAALLDESRNELSQEDLDRLVEMVEEERGPADG